MPGCQFSPKANPRVLPARNRFYRSCGMPAPNVTGWSNGEPSSAIYLQAELRYCPAGICPELVARVLERTVDGELTLISRGPRNMMATGGSEIVSLGSRAAQTSPRGPITMVVPLPPSYRGGTEEYAYRLANGFAQSRPTRILTTTVRWDAMASLLDTGQAKVERLPARELLERPVLTSRTSWARLRDSVAASSLVNLHMPFPGVEASVAREARRHGIPVVLTYHMDADLASAMPGPGASLLTKLYQRLSAHPALDSCDTVVANSRGYAESSEVLSRHLPKVTVIPKGVDPQRLGIGAYDGERDPPPCIPTERFRGDVSRLLFVGRLVPYKGIGVLLGAVENLARRGKDVGLIVAGKGPLRLELEQLAIRLRITDKVVFVGFVPDAQLGDLYRFADVTVVPSLGVLESSATTLEEAAACGCPVVGSDLPGAGESIPNDRVRGWLVPAGDVPALATAIEQMIATPRPPPPTKIRTWLDVKNDYLALFDKLGLSASSP